MTRTLAVVDRSWAESPCSTCSSSPCCTRLPLHRFHIETRGDLTFAATLVAYPRIEIGLYESGWWMAYYLASCRFLNPLDSKCLIHDTERQPTICKRYSPLRCWYKRVFADGISPDFIRFNATRLRLLETMVSFDAAGDLASVPSWEDMTAALGSLPLDSMSGRGTGDSAADSSALRAPDAIVPAGLALPLRAPRTRSDLDLLRFRLGFHGIRISIRRGEWLTLVDSPPEAENRPAMGYAEFESFVDKCSFDEAGRILHLPDIEAETTASGTER